MKWYNVQIYDKKDYSKYWYPIRAVSHTHATYKMCEYLIKHTDMSFSEFEIVEVKEMWWKKMKFQIIVNNLTTGERMVDAETDCIIGAFHNQANDTTAQIVFSHACGIDVSTTCVGAVKSLKKTLNSLAKPLKAATINAINGMLEEQEENDDE